MKNFLGALMVSIALTSPSFGFCLLDRMLGNGCGCCCEPSCSCCEKSCGCEQSCGCNSGCGGENSCRHSCRRGGGGGRRLQLRRSCSRPSRGWCCAQRCVWR